MPRPKPNPPPAPDAPKSTLDQGPGTLAHAIKKETGVWPEGVPLTTLHLTKILGSPEVEKALSGGKPTPENLAKAVAAQPVEFWKKWVADNVTNGEKVTRQTPKPTGKAGDKPAAGNTGGDLSPMRQRLLELDMKPEDVAKMTDDEVAFNVESIEKALAKSRTAGNANSELAQKKQQRRDENAAKRQKAAERDAKRGEKASAGPKSKPAAGKPKAVGADKDVVTSDDSEVVAGDDTAVRGTTDLDGMTVEQLQEALAKAKVRDAMGASQDVGVRLGQPGSTFTDMTSGSPSLDTAAGAAQAGDGSIIVGNVGGGIPSVQQVMPSGSPHSLQTPPAGLFAQPQSAAAQKPTEPFFKGFDALRGNPFGQYQKTDAATGNPAVDAQGNPVMADRWGRATLRKTPAAIAYGVGVPLAGYYGGGALIQALAGMRNQQAANPSADQDAIIARIKMNERFSGSRPVYAPDTPPAQ
jgi:hypothetical protein